MHDARDLNIQQEIIPFFDFTLNSFSRQALGKLMDTPLESPERIRERQQVLKGFISNAELLREYTYSRTDFYEVKRLLTESSVNKLSYSDRFRLLISENERMALKARFIQLVTLFHKLDSWYISRIRKDVFPDAYRTELKLLRDFLQQFNLPFYDRLILDNRFRNRHVARLSEMVSQLQAAGEIDLFYNRLAAFEALLSISQGIIKHGFAFPEISFNELIINELYYPQVKNPVKNNFSGIRNVTLLTGPNMSGKSTCLKSISLCIWLAHIGSAVPAASARIPFFDSILISINHSDDIVNGYSHFMQEVLRVKSVLNEAIDGRRCFAVFDELFKGTNPEDAVEISAASIVGMTKLSNAVFIISTHLHLLNKMNEIEAGDIFTCCLGCEIDSERPVFSYKLKEGWSDLKIGTLLFKQEGLYQLLASVNG
ncbi:DNA mismatch repair protein MutS [bioreactor metagenome]|jgi:DNA mismatch repair protein MutS|uniref:DNA mismatch repair protein MutS n=1 Tax=bioreactor metagenome TaxID=1076179 RepID=A0A644UNQ8_9ZZZZ|nr:hypothetical protein [Lentimicrobium sp.]MEA5112298.1 hypothetical protein [Lentimicrobium sp.]